DEAKREAAAVGVVLFLVGVERRETVVAVGIFARPVEVVGVADQAPADRRVRQRAAAEVGGFGAHLYGVALDVLFLRRIDRNFELGRAISDDLEALTGER